MVGERLSLIRLATDHDREKWDAFVITQEHSGPYHHFAWKQAVEVAYNHRGYYLIYEDNDHIKGVLPLVLVKPPLTRGSLVSLPFCDYGGVLASDQEVVHTLLHTAFDLASTLKTRIILRYLHPEVALNSHLNMDVNMQKVRMVLGLPNDSEALWNSFKSKLRSQIKKPQKEGLEFKLGDIDCLRDFYTIFRHNMRELGSPVHSYRWLSSVVEAYGKNARVGVVYKGALPVASGIILASNDMLSIPWASSLSEFNKLSPNMLLYWGLLRYACDNGFKFFDFGRSTTDEGTYKFKQQWGALPTPLYWYEESRVTHFAKAPLERNSRVMAAWAWSRLPQVITDVLGPIVRQYITL